MSRKNKKTGNGTGLIRQIGQASAWLTAVLMIAILVQVVLRYAFGKSYVALEEIQWHIFAVIILISMSYAYVREAHIRLDILHPRFSPRIKEYIEIAGIVLLLWPMIVIFFLHSLPFVAESFRVGECSDAPMGLKYRWLIKSMIPISFTLLFAASLLRLKTAWNRLTSQGSTHGR